MNLHHFTRDARYTLTKSILKNKLKVEVYYRILRCSGDWWRWNVMFFSILAKEDLVEDLVNSDEHFFTKIYQRSRCIPFI